MAEAEGRDCPELQLPFIEPSLNHLIDYLFEVGPSTAGEVLSFQEIAAWSAATGRTLTPWEAVTLRRLSSAYLSEAHAASDPDRAPPGGYKIPATPFEGAFQALMSMATVVETPALKRQPRPTAQVTGRRLRV